MDSFTVTVVIERNGQRLENVSIAKRLTAIEYQEFGYNKADDPNATTFSALPLGHLETLNVLVVKSEKQITLRVDGQMDGGIVIQPGGYVLLLGVTIDAGEATNAVVNNDTGETVHVVGMGARL